MAKFVRIGRFIINLERVSRVQFDAALGKHGSLTIVRFDGDNELLLQDSEAAEAKALFTKLLEDTNDGRI